jgi:hypothetical protein
MPLPIDQIPTQQGTDMEYIRYLAEQAGCSFTWNRARFPEQGVLGAANQSRHAATGAKRRHGRLHQRRGPAFIL